MIDFGRPTLFTLATALLRGSLAAGEPPRHASARRIVVHPRPPSPAAKTLGVAVASGVTVRTPFTIVAGDPGRVVRVPPDVGPDGSYDERSDFIQSVYGIPCGQECTRRSLRRWGYEPVD